MVLVAALAVGCEGPPDSTVELDSQWIGWLDDDPSVMFGVAVDEGMGAVYACGDGDTLDTHTQWMTGAAQVFEDGGVLIDCGAEGLVQLGGDARTARGLFIDDRGRHHTFTVERVRKGSLAGIYHDGVPKCPVAALVYHEGPGAEPVVQGAACDARGVWRQVVPMGPVRLTADGLPVGVAYDPADDPMPMFLPPLSL